jgi:hypothetical protein
MPSGREPDEGVVAIGRLNVVPLPVLPAARRHPAPLCGLVLESPLAIVDPNDLIASPSCARLVPHPSLGTVRSPRPGGERKAAV